jgi:hypothetical protein
VPAKRAALGLKVRTGRAVVVAVAGPVDSPEILGKTRIQVAFTFDEGAVFHVAQNYPPERARALVQEREVLFTERALGDLRAFAARQDFKVVGAGMAAPPIKRLPPFESILKAHPLLHAAEGEFYRRVFADACAKLRARPSRTPVGELTTNLAEGLGLKPAVLAKRLDAMGKASGRPWAVDQKEATLAAWSVLLGARAQ